MRVIAGKLGGQQFDSSKGHRTHPMSEKARGGLFNMLGDIEGLSVLDAFGGSGALTFEAVSRGALCSTVIDSDRKAYLTIVKNTRALGLNKTVKVVMANAGSWSNNNRHDLYDIVLCDPPFDQLREELLLKLAKHVKPGGIYVLAWPGSDRPIDLTNHELLTVRSYGDIQLAVYR